jgi:hypothetical protein
VSEFGAYAFVALLGAFVGCGEILSRYTDRPGRSLMSGPGFGYVGVNSGVAVLTLYLVETYQLAVAPSASVEGHGAISLTRILGCGLGSMALLRSSFGMIKVGGRDVALGLAPLMQVLLDSADRAIGRSRAVERVEETAAIMRELDSEKSVKLLPPYCSAAVPSLSAEAKENIARDTAALELILAKNPTNPTLPGLVGLMLMDHVGPTVLRKAVESLGSILKAGPTTPSPPGSGGS